VYTGSISRGVKRSGREAGHSPLTSADIKTTWNYPIRLHDVVKHRVLDTKIDWPTDRRSQHDFDFVCKVLKETARILYLYFGSSSTCRGKLLASLIRLEVESDSKLLSCFRQPFRIAV
jgi:hypothetical protein